MVFWDVGSTCGPDGKVTTCRMPYQNNVASIDGLARIEVLVQLPHKIHPGANI